jgi:hypothetical protein
MKPCSGRTLRYASGIDLDPFEGGNASSRRRAVVPTVCAVNGAGAPPRHPDVLNKGFGFDHPPSVAPGRKQRLVAIRPPSGP